jgi:predicted TIM-barrel fold metal-dependent hydrolase
VVTLLGFVAVWAQISATAGPQAPRFTPLVDYHQHLASPAGVALLNRSLPTIDLPAGLAAVLKRRGDNWNNLAVLADLYTENTLMLAPYSKPNRGWIRGRDSAVKYIGARMFDGPYHLTPVASAVRESSAYVAGYYTEGEGTMARHFGYFYLDLDKESDGAWRIAEETMTFEPRPVYQETISGDQLVALLDSAGIKRAVLLSDAYWFDAPTYRLPSESTDAVYTKVRAENDWTADQAAKSGGRLVAFCSFNPLESYALTELRRCVSSRRFTGLKLHLQQSGVDLLDPEHVARVRRVFELANQLRFPITVHAQTKASYGREAAQVFVTRLLPVAPDIPITIAHLWGGGPFKPEALAVYVDAVASRAPGTKNLFFDVAEAALVANGSREKLQEIVAAIRRIGPEHILFGSDAVGPSTLAPQRAAAQFRKDVPLTEDEFRIIAGNVAPYLR